MSDNGIPWLINPYGEPVDPSDPARVWTRQGWCPASDFPPLRALRDLPATQARWAWQALAVPEVSAAVNHDPARWAAACGWSMPPSTARELQQRAWGDQINQAWANHRLSLPGLPRWELAAAAPSATAWRGLQWGLGSRLVARVCRDPGQVWHEWGLTEAQDSALRRLPPHRYRVHAQRAGADPSAPAFDSSRPWPKAAAASSRFHVATHQSAQEPGSPPTVVWLTASSVSYGSRPWLLHWLARLGLDNEAWVVSTINDPEIDSVLAGWSQSTGCTHWQVALPCPGPVCRIWARGPGMPTVPQPIRQSLAHWSPCPTDVRLPAPDAAPVVQAPTLSPDEPVDGRVPAQQAEALRGALIDWRTDHPPVTTWLAQKMGLTEDQVRACLSPEQRDALALAYRRLSTGAGFMLIDATGFGKGRVLAALVRIGIREGRAVAWLTENAPLFVDAWRDMTAVCPDGSPPEPTLLHADQRIVTPQGPIGRPGKPASAERWQPSDWPDDSARWVVSTYAQFRRAGDVGKRQWLSRRLGPTGWLLLDESHNAAGDSQVSSHLTVLTRQHASVFASATYARHEGNLDIYRPAMSMPPLIYARLKAALTNDAGPVRDAVTWGLARAGCLVRRDHPPIPPPRVVWLDLDEEQATGLAAFVSAWQALFEAVEWLARAQGRAPGQVWEHLGGLLARTVNEFSLLLKRNAVVDAVCQAAAEGHKAVVALDSTLEAIMRDTLADPTSPGPVPTWRDRWRQLIADLVPVGFWTALPAAEQPLAQAAWEACQSTANNVPAWSLAVIDDVKQRLRTAGIRVDELSGRRGQWLGTSKSGQWRPRPKTDRVAIVAGFNAGHTDALIITRAGSTGISLHAGRAFADQRPRRMIEWETAANPVVRVQFWGRIRRRDQVVDPDFITLALDTLSARRRSARDRHKQQLLSAHAGQSSIASSSEDSGMTWLSPVGEAVVAEWAQDEPVWATRLGVARPLPGQPTGRVDRLLARGLLLPDPVRDRLTQRLRRGLEIGQAQGPVRPERQAGRSVRHAWWWGNPDQPLGPASQALSVLRLDMVERTFVGGPPPDRQMIERALDCPGLSGQQALDRWHDIWRHQTQAGVEATAQRRHDWQVANRLLSGLTPGATLWFGDPDAGDRRPSRFLGVDVPNNDDWTLSQVALRLWVPGDHEPRCLSLQRCALDPHYALDPRPLSTRALASPSPPLIACTIEGNAVMLADWGRRWGAGRALTVVDPTLGARLAWRLPASWTWQTLQALPRDLIDVGHLMAFWKAHPDQPVLAAQPTGRWWAHAQRDGVVFRVEESAYAHARATWLHAGLDRALRLAPTGAGSRRLWSRTLTRKQARAMLFRLQAAGVVWRIDAKHQDWYRRSSREILSGKAKV